ncbi:hypothetical protein EX530_20580 [Xanthomonas phaseoli]
MGAIGASAVIAGARAAATTGAVRATVICGVTGAAVAMPPAGKTSAMDATGIVEGAERPATTGAAGAVRAPLTIGTAEACAMAALPATANSNAERRHSTREVVWIM